MSKLTYAVIRDGDCWRIVGERRRFGRFDSCEQAAVAAVQLAREASASDHAVEVLVQDTAGQLWPVVEFEPAARDEAA